MNVSLLSLRGRHHPCLANIVTTQEVKKLRPYLKLLTGDYLTYQRKYDDSGQGSPHCQVCHCHIVAVCPQYQDTRQRILFEIQEQCLLAKTNVHFQDILYQPEVLTQFILDPTSFNLRNRIHFNFKRFMLLNPQSKNEETERNEQEERLVLENLS